MKIVLDDKIPYIREAVAQITADAVYLPGAKITPADVADADALIVRTRTRCNKELLAGSRVRFVATATIGTDHLDTAWLDSAGIAWANCPGCNAASVRQWVECSLLQIELHYCFPLRGKTIGVVGLGHVGSRVAAMAESRGMRVLACDPPLQHSGAAAAADCRSLDELCREADIITFHVPLTRQEQSQWPTWHIADKEFFGKLKKKPWFINSSRGPVMDTPAVVEALDKGQIAGACIDTWEDEPAISSELLRRAFIATPHIAGYSADGKTRADNMALAALCAHFGIARPADIVPPEGAAPADAANPLCYYDPLIDTKHLRLRPDAFEQLRGNYPVRREQP